MGASGTVHARRIERARELLTVPDRAEPLCAGSPDQVFVTRIQDIRWLTGFTGSNAVMILGKTDAVFLTDGRYRTQATVEVSEARVLIAETDLLQDAAELFKKAILIQSDHLTLAQRKRLGELAPDTRFIEKENLLSQFRATKDAAEVALVQEALSISEKTITACLENIKSGITERELAAEIDYQHTRFGSEGPAFDTIVAFGARSALPHARPGNVRLLSGDVVLIDCGCTRGGYCSDITRTFLYGTDKAEVRDVYAVVLEALNAAVAEARSGIRAAELDAAARAVIESAGYADFFVHSLGHGVGLEIHEMPKINKLSNQILPENAIITVEPGIYLPDRFGIRIEEMVLLTSDGGQRLNDSPTKFTLL